MSSPCLYVPPKVSVVGWCVGGVEQGGPLLELGAASLLFVIRREVDASVTRNAEVREEMGAWTQFRCFACVLFHFVKQKCKKYSQ